MGLSDVLDRVRRAEKKAGRPEGSVTLVAVSKVQPLDRIDAVLKEGHRVFGENRVQEAQGKWSEFRERFDGISLHIVGPLQTNKVKAALAIADVIETVDRESLAAKLSTEIEKSEGPAPALLVQVNTGEEPQKAGVAPQDADRFIEMCRETQGLTISGLMAIPPADAPPEPHFALLASIAERQGLTTLSMGMSADFEKAIEFGATHVRVGSAVFGARTPPA